MKKLDKIREYIRTRKLVLTIFFLILIVLTMPLLQKNLSVADDYLFHLARIQSITDSLENGIFPVKIHFPMACNCGYGTGFFYPNMFLYIPAIINLIVANTALAYKLFIGIYVALLFVVSYFSLKTTFKNQRTALLGTMLIMLSNGLMLNLYNRTALGEYLGFFFIIPLICGLYNFVNDDFDKPYLIAIGFIGVLNSHLITTIICIVFAILYLLVNIKKVFEKPKNILKLIGVAIIVLLITSAFWVPMLEQLTDQTFKLSDSWTVIGNEEFYIFNLLGNGKYSLGMVLILGLPLIIYGLFDKGVDKKYKIFAGFALFIMFLMLCSPFWKLTNQYTNIIQFKWRLLGITTILTSMSLSYMLVYYIEKINIKYEYVFCIMSVFIFYIALTNLNGIVASHDVYSNDYINTILYTVPESIGGGQEYLPENLKYSKIVIEENIATTDSKMQLPVVKEGLSGTVNIINDYHVKTLEVPFIYYKGYVANITSVDGVVTLLEVEESEDGFVKVIIPNELVGNVRVWYNGTQLQKISYLITFGTVCLVIVGYIVYFVKNKLYKKEVVKESK